MSVEIPHFAYPFTITTSVAVVEQDTTDELLACAQHLVRCPVGFRLSRPDFGWSFPEFRTIPLNTNGLVAALERFGPAGQFTASEVADTVDASVRHISVQLQQVGG